MSSRNRNRKQTIVIASIVIGIISMILMGILKKTLVKIPLFNNILQLKNVGLDSMKDFLEVSELNLRVEEPKSARYQRTNSSFSFNDFDNDMLENTPNSPGTLMNLRNIYYLCHQNTSPR